MPLCPNKNSNEWKKLVEAYGSSRAAIAFFRKGDGSIPDIKEAEKILGVSSSEPLLGTKKFADWVEQDEFNKKPFIDKLKESVSGKIQDFKELGKRAVQTVFPKAFENNFFASMAETIIRKSGGKAYMQNVIADKAAKETMDFWNKQPYNVQMHFMNAMENPGLYDLSDEPLMMDLFDSYKTRLDAVFNSIKDIKDLPYFEDYFPHFWKDPKKATGVFSKGMSKRPLEGSKSFLRQRFFKDIKAGMEAGLELITTNPEELVRIAEMNATKFKMGNDVFTDFKDSGMLEYHKTGDAPEGWELVDDSLFKRMAPYAKKEGGELTGEAGIAMGGWYMPSDAARIVNNYLSKGLSGVKGVRHVYESVRYLNNLKNTFQLGLSGFHYLTTSIDASITTTSLGMNLVLSGKPKNFADGLRLMGEGIFMIPTISKNYAKSNSVFTDLYGGKISADIESLMNVNARVAGEKQWQINAEYEFNKALQQVKKEGVLGAPGESMKAALNMPLIVLEKAAKPIMEYHVPRMKVAGFLKTVENEIKLNPTMTAEELQTVKQKAWDDMDDRLGQVVYDNLFWNKTMKDLSFMTIRSFGWTAGTMRAVGKGVTEIPNSLGRLSKGQGMSPRTAWLVALPLQVGLYGGLLHYIFTGEKPKELKDYFFPKDGTKNPDGSDRRVTLPTYMKDIVSYKRDPYKTLSNKFSPIINEAAEIYNNKDFYGAPIYDEEDNFFQKGADILNYEAKSFTPFGFREMPGKEVPFFSQQSIESKVGLTPAPAMFQRTDLENKINERLLKDMNKSKKQVGYNPNESAFKKIIAEEIREGKKFKDISVEEKKKAGLVDDKGKLLSTSKAINLIKSAKIDNAQRMFKYLSAESQLDIISKASKEDIDYLMKKRMIFKKPLDFVNLKRTKPEVFVKHPEYKKAYEVITKRKFETPQIIDESNQEDTEQ